MFTTAENEECIEKIENINNFLGTMGGTFREKSRTRLKVTRVHARAEEKMVYKLAKDVQVALLAKKMK